MVPRPGRLALALALHVLAARAGVVVEPVPDAGLQPAVATDASGTIHLAYLRGDPKASDVVVRRRAPDAAARWSEPVVANTQPGSALAVGSVRGVRIAAGRGGRVHLVWNGSAQAAPKPEVGAPLVFTTLGPGSTPALPQRCLSNGTRHLDGGAAVAADAAGTVLVAWHAAPMDREGEDQRRVWLARSDDDGTHFAAATPIAAASGGACGCCGLQASIAGNAWLVLYRRAERREERGMSLLVSRDRGATWERIALDDWAASQCPMSTASILPADGGAWLAWERAGRVRYARWHPASGLGAIAELGTGGRKHPALAVDADGKPVVAWTSGTGWERGGSLGWTVAGSRDEGTAPGVPVWGTVAAYAAADGVHVLR